MGIKFSPEEEKVIEQLSEKYWKKKFLDMVTQVVQENIDFKEICRRFNDLYSDWYEYSTYRGDFKIVLYWTTYRLEKLQKCEREFEWEVEYEDDYEKIESFDFTTGKWEDDEEELTLQLQGESYQKKAKMILEKLQELIKEKESKNNDLVFKHRG